MFNGKINADNLSEDNIYILPAKVQSSNPLYVIDQDEYVYIVVELTELRVTIVGASATAIFPAYTSRNSYSGSFVVELNSMLGDDLTVNFYYDPS